jgi:hypothetical protein
MNILWYLENVDDVVSILPYVSIKFTCISITCLQILLFTCFSYTVHSSAAYVTVAIILCMFWR